MSTINVRYSWGNFKNLKSNGVSDGENGALVCSSAEKVLERAIGNNLKISKGKYTIRECNCLFGRDIGAYNTCLHGCKYCYANSNMKLVKKNNKLHNPDSELLIGEIGNSDVVKEIKEPSYIETYEKVVPLTRTFQSTLL